MNTINRYRVGTKFFADLFAAIDYAEKRGWRDAWREGKE